MKRAKLITISIVGVFSFIIQPLYLGTIPALADSVPTSTSTSTMPTAQGTNTTSVIDQKIVIFTLILAIPAPAPSPSASPTSKFTPMVTGMPAVVAPTGAR